MGGEGHTNASRDLEHTPIPVRLAPFRGSSRYAWVRLPGWSRSDRPPPDQEGDHMVPARTESPAAARRGSPRPARPPVESREPGPERAWRETLAPYAQAHTGRALLGLATSVV